MQTAFLKCYYGYKNFGDELLLFGVLDRIADNIPIRKLYIEAGDKARLETRLRRNKQHRDHIPYTIHILQINKYPTHIVRDSIKIFGGGEVLNDQDVYIPSSTSNIKNISFKLLGKCFTRSGRNYLLKYHNDIFRKNFYILGGIGRPRRKTTKLLYNMMLPRARQIITRDSDSYAIAHKYNKNTIQWQDFSTNTVNNFYKEKKHLLKQSDYMLCNISSHSFQAKHIQTLTNSCQSRKNLRKIFFPCDMQDDFLLRPKLKNIIPGLELYDWTQHSLNHTLSFLAKSTYAVGSRLHFLYPLKLMQVPVEPIVYKDKVKKLIIDEDTATTFSQQIKSSKTKKQKSK